MSAEYMRMGGIGIRITEEMFSKLKAVYNKQEEDFIIEDIAKSHGLKYIAYGNCWEGKLEYAWVITGDKYIEVICKIPAFLEKLEELGFSYTENDLEIITEILIC